MGLESIGKVFADKFQRYLPTAFTLAIILTILAAGISYVVSGAGPVEMATAWFNGFWSVLGFIMQIVLIVVLAYCIGTADLTVRGLNKLADKIETPRMVYLVSTIVGIFLVYINWGLLIPAGIFAYQLAKRVKGVDYRVLCAAVYGTALVWHGGLAATAPLMMSTQQAIQSWVQQGIIDNTVPVTETIFSPMNLIILPIIAIIVITFFQLIIPDEVDEKYDLAKQVEKRGEEEIPEEEGEEGEKTPAEKIDRFWPLSTVIYLTGFAYLIYHFYTKGLAGMNLNSVNFFFLMLGLALHQNLWNYLQAMQEAVKSVANIVLQFPFYAGIAGIFTGTGTAAAIASWFAGLASPATWPAACFTMGSVVNIFVPSGGGEWLVVGPAILQATENLGVSYGTAIMSYAYGDACTNMIQPFWAVIILSAMAAALPKGMEIRARDIMGYTAVLGLITFVTWIVLVTVVPMVV